MNYTVLIPYRTAGTMLLILWSSPVPMLHFGLGLSSMVPMLIGTTVGLAILLFPLGKLKGNTTKRLIATARTVLALLAVFYVNIGYISGSGSGRMITRSINQLELGGLWRALLMMLVLTLVIDLLTGFAQEASTQSNR